MKIVLSIDGGGVRGIIPVAILNYLERRIQDIQGDSRIRLGNLVDFVAGTSSGAVLGALMLLPSDTKSPWAKLDMIEITDIYMEFVEKFFSTNLRYKIKTLWGYRGPKYPLNLVEEPLLKYFNHYKIEKLIKPCIITGYDISKREIVLYTNLKNDGKYTSYYIKDIIKSAVATPSFFQPGYFHEGADINTIIAGDLFSGNPSMLALTEAHKNGIINSIELDEVYFLSIGTGLGHGLKRKYPYETVKNWGKSQWLIPLLDIVISSSQDSIEKETRTLFESQNCLENYHRINPPIIYSSGSAADPTKENLMNSIKDAIKYIEENKVYLEEIANKICRLKYLIRVDD